MRVYVENVGKTPIYVLKNTVGIGERIDSDILEKRFGDEVDTSNPNTFAAWLSENKFMDRNTWRVVIEDEPTESKQEKPKEKPKEKLKEKKKEDKPVSKVTATNRELITKVVGGVSKEITIEDVVNMKVSDLGQLDRIKDEKLLRAALKKAESMTQKATLCNKLRDRLTEFDIR
ncbi:MAG: hypothetical protein U9R15_09695 [Chloroflexota bacterium]|nr:hypothetical protein [Chloroflexota bacterium]